MNDDNTFSSVNELYRRLLPAINTKISELERIHFNVKNIDIWNYCVSNIWKKEKDLRMYKMVSDILNIDEIELNKFLNNRNGE